MVKATTIDDLKNEYEKICHEESKLEQELLQLRAEKDGVRLAIDRLTRRSSSVSQVTGVHAHIKPSQIAHCKTHLAAWSEIARLSDGLAKLSDGAQLLIDAGLSKGKRRSVISSIITQMEGNDDWEKVGPSTYRWLPYEKPIPEIGGDVPVPDPQISEDEEAWLVG